MHLTIHTDGGSRGNPGIAAAGITIADTADGQAVYEAGIYLGQATNNEAEYQGLIRGLAKAAQIGADEVAVHADSELMVRQVNGEYRVKSDRLKPLLSEVKQTLGQFKRWSVTHVRREYNERADKLANQSMDAQADIN